MKFEFFYIKAYKVNYKLNLLGNSFLLTQNQTYQLLQYK